MPILAGVPRRRQTTVGLSTTVIFGDFGGRWLLRVQQTGEEFENCMD